MLELISELIERRICFDTFIDESSDEYVIRFVYESDEIFVKDDIMAMQVMIQLF